MLKRLGIFILMTMPSGASALSCGIYGINQVFWNRQAADATYELVYGTFTNLRDGTHLPAEDMDIWTATFDGFRASANGFDQPLLTEVTIHDPLFTGIAGGEKSSLYLDNWLPGQTGVVFLQQTETGYLARTELCLPFVYTEAADAEMALNCLNGRRCPKE
jgi:hypothetical protein